MNDELLRLNSIEPDDLLRLDSAFALYNRLGQVVMQLAPDEYISVRIAGDALRTITDTDAHGWPPGITEVIEAVDGDAQNPDLRREALAFHREEYQGKVLHSQARQRTKSRVLLLLVPVLLGLVAGFAALVERSTGHGPNETLLVGTAGALGATLSGTLRLRDLRAGLGALRSFKSVLVIQPLIGAAFALLVALILDAGLAGIELPTNNDQRSATLAIFGFVAGYSEPFALGIVNKMAAMEPSAPSGKDEVRQAPKT